MVKYTSKNSESTIYILIAETTDKKIRENLQLSLRDSITPKVNILTYDIPDDSFRVILAGLREASTQRRTR